MWLVPAPTRGRIHHFKQVFVGANASTSSVQHGLGLMQMQTEKDMSETIEPYEEASMDRCCVSFAQGEATIEGCCIMSELGYGAMVWGHATPIVKGKNV